MHGSAHHEVRLLGALPLQPPLVLPPPLGSKDSIDPRAFTKAYRAESSKLTECPAQHGAIAAVMVGKVCTHVALVLELDGELMVLEINPDKGARKLRLSAWLNEHVRVTFHND